MTALAFALVGHVYDETHTRYLPELGGLGTHLPFIATCAVFAAMASSGLPGFANFVAELLVILGSWDRYPLQAVLAVLGVVITSVYMLRMVRGVFFGTVSKALPHLSPGLGTAQAGVIDARTWFARSPYLVLIVWLLLIGCWPQPLIRLIDTSARPFIKRVLDSAQMRIAPADRALSVTVARHGVGEHGIPVINVP
jgi:NADH-quinone oxidoreductase subunit M